MVNEDISSVCIGDSDRVWNQYWLASRAYRMCLGDVRMVCMIRAFVFLVYVTRQIFCDVLLAPTASDPHLTPEIAAAAGDPNVLDSPKLGNGLYLVFALIGSRWQYTAVRALK